MSTFHLPLKGSQSNHFIFQMKKPDTNSGPLFPILLHSKAETRYVHGMGARSVRFEANDQVSPSEISTEKL